MSDADKDVQDILNKYKQRLEKETKLDDNSGDNSLDENPGYDDSPVIDSRHYKQFKEEMITDTHGWYEKACNISESLIKLSPDKKKLPEIKRAIETAHLEVTPTGVATFAMLAPLLVIFVSVVIFYFIPFALNIEPSMFVLFFFIFAGLALMMPLQNIPYFLANQWRLKSSNEMVLAVFYVVTYMRHTSNLELAIEFAANHLTGPLALDLRKIIWDVETERYATVKESMDTYLESWRDYNMEFIEAMHLIESSLYEGTEDNRLKMLDKSLEVMLDETFEKMMHYAHNLQSPLTTLNMLGFVLPILGLVILPLMVNFMQTVKWYHIFLLYSVGIPAGVYYLGKKILASRPTGYGDSDIMKNNPYLNKLRGINYKFLGKERTLDPMVVAVSILVICLLIGFSPIIFVVTGIQNVPFGDMAEDYRGPCDKGTYCFLEFRTQTIEVDGSKKDITAGPFDLIPSILSVFVPLGIGLSIGIYHKIRTERIVKIRDESKKLEKEFSSGLFQLGNRLGDGLPAEIAFGKVAKVMRNTVSGNFFSDVSQNITQKGMGVEEALFDRNAGIIYRYPSSIIESSMKVMVEAVKKSPKIAAQAVISISTYIKEMHRIDERLRDLLADVISSMKSQASFLAPVIAAVVIAISSMITNVLGQISVAMLETGDAGGAGGLGLSDSFFGIGIPTFHFQIIVGIYVIALIYILTMLLNGVENGADELKEKYLIGNNLIRGTLIYCSLALAGIIAFNLIANVVITQTL